MADCGVTHYSWEKGFDTHKTDGFSHTQPDSFEHCWYSPKSIGRGMIRRIIIRDGYELWVTDFLFRRDTCFSFQGCPSFLLFGFYLSGHYEAVVGKPERELEFCSEHQYLLYMKKLDGFGEVKAGTQLRSVSIAIRPEMFFSYFEDDIGHLPSVFQRIFEEQDGSIFRRIRGITPSMHIALRQIVDCPYRGIARKLFLESRSLELMAYRLKHLSVSETTHQIREHVMHPGDRDRTEFAKNLLLSNLEAPPHLDELAAVTGMSHPKLNRCFRQMFGKTVFQYLKDERLRQARVMIENQGLTVTETAYSVGYSSLSHFAKAYKHHFGVSPGADCRRKKGC